MPLGDSITDGVGSSDGGGYRHPLSTAFPALVTFGPNPNFDGGNPDTQPWYWHAGFDGFNSGQLANLTNGTTADLFNQFGSTNVVLLHTGTNDYGTTSGDDPHYTVNNVLAIRTNFFARRPPGGRLAFVVMLPILGGSAPSNNELNTYITALRPLLNTALTGLTQTYIATPPSIPDGDYLGGAFGIHPLDAGYALMVDDGSGNGWKSALIAAGF